MMPAIANCGSRNIDRPEIMIKGMAKPTAPFTKPAAKVTPRARAKAQYGIRCKKSVMAAPCLGQGIAHIQHQNKRDILILFGAFFRINVALHLQNDLEAGAESKDKFALAHPQFGETLCPVTPK